MKVTNIITIITMLILSLLSSANININIFIFIFIVSLFTITIDLSKFGKTLICLFLISFFIRVFVIFFDLYGNDLYIFPGSGGDTEDFFYYASIINNNLTLLKENIYGGAYTKILGLFFHFISYDRFLAQYINVFLSLMSSFYLLKTMTILCFDRNIIKKVLIFSLFFPNNIILSSILLRESFIVFFVMLSIYNFVKWNVTNKKKFMIMSIITVLCGSMFHSGVIFLIIGYMYVYILYDIKKDNFNLNIKSIFLIILFSFIAYIVFFKSQNLFLGKFIFQENDNKDIFNYINSSRGGSSYLTNLKQDNLLKVIIYLPLKIVYFLCSPIFIDWRGISDIIAFFMDSCVYLFCIIYNIKNIKYLKYMLKNNIIFKGLFISLVLTIIVFSISISNTGTAIRHRNKIFLPILLEVALIYKAKEEKIFNEKV